MTNAFRIGQRVRWSKARSSDFKDAEGTIVGIAPAIGLPELTLYEIQFAFGNHTLSASQIEPAEQSERDFA